MSNRSEDKIPFSKDIADSTLKTCDLAIQLCKEWSKENKREEPYLTLKELRQLKRELKKRYYNEKVELLEVLR